MICLALVADAVIGNVQEKTIRQFGATNSEVNSFEPTSHLTGPLQVVLYSYSIGFVYLFFLVAVFTDIASAIHYCSYYPKASFMNIKCYHGIFDLHLNSKDFLFWIFMNAGPANLRLRLHILADRISRHSGEKIRVWRKITNILMFVRLC